MIDESEKETSEFGMGYAYCLGLFIAHERQIFQFQSELAHSSIALSFASLWFNGAADHFYDLQIPKALSVEKKKEIADFRNQCIRFRLCMNGEKCTIEDAKNAVQKAKDLLREWDEFNGIPTMKGEYE